MRLEYSVSCSSVARHAQDIIRYDTTTINDFWRLEYFKRSCIEGPAYLMERFSASWIHIMEEAFRLGLSVFARSIILSREFPGRAGC